MLFKTTIVSTMALLFASSAMGASVHQDRGALIATDAVSACNCPNNCKHHDGSSCKFYSGPSDTSSVISGHCAWHGDTLSCTQ